MTSVRFRSLAKQTKQDGFALMGVVIAIAIIGMILATYYWREAQQNKITEAQILGNQLAQYVSAVQARMSGDGTFAVGTYSDLSFLKSNTCTGVEAGIAPEHYLPCNFNFKRFQSELMAKDPMTNVSDMVSDKRTATITVDSITTRDGSTLVVSPFLGAVVSQAAQAHFGADQNAVYNGAAVYHYDKDTAVITIDVNVQGTNSKWLCIDGCNKMEANLKFDPNKPESEREIQDVSNIRLNNPNAEISGNGNLAIRSTAQMTQIAENIVAQANSNYQATAANQAYIGGNVSKLVGNSQAEIASGSQKITIDPSQIVVSATAFNNNAETTNINSTTTNINTSTGTVNLGKQSGIAGDSNVIVNDLTIHAEINGQRDQKLSTLLSDNPPYYQDFSTSSRTLDFAVRAGKTGSAIVHVYGGMTSGQGYNNFGAFTLSFKRSGSILRTVTLQTMEQDSNTRHSSAAPSFEYYVTGLQPNSMDYGYQVELGGKGIFQYVGYSVDPR